MLNIIIQCTINANDSDKGINLQQTMIWTPNFMKFRLTFIFKGPNILSVG